MKKYSLFQKMISLVLAIVFVGGLVPATANAAVDAGANISNRVSDPSTMNEWENYFGPNVKNTEFVGGVWTDKSVLTSADAFMADITMKDPQNNFLIALSAIAANQHIVGYTSEPLDVMLVLDVSGSMANNDKDEAMVDSANLTLHTLMSQHQNNRVGIVLYSGNANTSQNAGTGTATVILPLDHYTTTATDTVRVTGENGAASNMTIGKYLNLSGSSVSVNSSVRNSENVRVYGSKNVSGGTYIQNGIYKAWSEFSEVTDTVVPEGNPQAGVQRVPVMILMSDGQPTLATASYNNVGTSNSSYGNGGENSTNNRTVFLTQLTAAWAKGKMEAHYKTTPMFYTVGLGTATSQHATAVLNPSQSNNTVDGYWETFLASTRASVNVGDGLTVSKDSNVKAQNYADGYWAASDAASLLAAFQGIMQTIEVETAGHVTLVEAAGDELSGYVTIVDELGCFMEVKDVKGLVLGNQLFTGYEVAKSMQDNTNMGTVANPTEYGNEFVATVRERLGITDVTVAQQLIVAAYNDGQLAFNDNGTATTADDTFSNYIGWYSDSDGKYLGFWDKDAGITAEGAPEGAVWINKSYGYLGTNGTSDMMHVVVMVCTHIESGMQVVQYKIPAALLPKVTYEVTLEDAATNQVESLVRKEAFPLRLVYEVGLQSGLNSVNLEEKLTDLPEGVHVHENADGTYHFYTNLWGAENGGAVDYNDPLSHKVAQSHFHPAEDNDRYYFTEDTLIRLADGTVYTGAEAPTGSYYHERGYYQETGFVTKLLRISPETLAQAQRNAAGQWYIPKGLVFQQIERFYMLKGGDANSDGKADSNLTGTLEYFDHPVVVRQDDVYDVYAFLGNNGRLTLVPSQGIKLSKSVTETVTGAPETFTFKVTLSQAVASPAVTDADGKDWTQSWSVSGNVITVSLKAGQTVYITDLPAGVSYSVEEEASRYYAASSANATGVVSAYTINAVDFTNTPKGYGSLIVSKDVEHPYTNVAAALAQKEFVIHVTLSGDNVANATFPVTGSSRVTSVTTDANGMFTVILRENESLTVQDLPENTTFVTTETLDANTHRGFSVDEERSQLSGTIVKDTTVQTHVVNRYAPNQPLASLQVSGTKILKDAAGTFDWAGKNFTMRLEQYDSTTGTYTTLGEQTVTQGSLTYRFDSQIKLDAIGTYYFKVSEVIPADRLEGMSYDATTGRIRVEVTDNDVDGYLEFKAYDYDTNQEITGTNMVFDFVKDFTNTHTTDATFVELTVDKHVVDPHNTGVGEAGFLFELFAVENGTVSANPAYTMRTVLDGAGQGHAVFHIPVTEVGTREFVLKEYIPSDKIPGMIYDATEYTVIVEGVADNGKLVPKLTVKKGNEIQDLSAGNISFTNEIDLEPVVLTPYINKTIDGRAPMAGDSFTFHIEQTNGSFVPGSFPGGYTDQITADYAKLVAGGNVYAKEIELATVGTYYFRAWETPGNAGGMTYDSAIYHVTVDVTPENDQLVKTVTFVKVGSDQTFTQMDSVKFVNIYRNTDTAEVVFGGTKKLEGRSLITGEFSFQLIANGTILQTVSNRADGTFAFSPITYTAADVGEHIYYINEVKGSLGGVTYSQQNYKITVTVTDNGQGELIATVTGADNVVFTNTYATEDTELALEGSKSWYNTDTGAAKPMQGGEFTFELYASDAAYTAKGSELTDTNDAQGAFSFKLEYTKPDTYYYILSERIDDAQGVGYDTSEYHIAVAVYDDGQGKLVANVTNLYKVGTGKVNAITFGNVYTPDPIEHTVEGEKVLTGRPLLDGEFEFQIFAADANFAPTGAALQTVSDIGGKFTFSALEFTKSGTYYYAVKEVIPAQAVGNVYHGVAYDTSVIGIKIEVTDNGKGALEKTVTVTENGAAAELKFENAYTVTNFTSFSVSGEKKLSGKAIEAGVYVFELYDADGNRIASVTNDANGFFTFADIPLDAVGKHTFTVKEVNNGLGGITYDSAEYTVTVEVDDDGLGNLVAGKPAITLGSTAAELIFRNSYKTQPVTYQPRVLKILENKTLEAGMFTFRLHSSENVLLQEKTNKAGGGVEFDPIEYQVPGTYTYYISEVVPEGGVKDGITYDTHTAQLTVVVTDNGDGTMSVEATYTGSHEFTNVYAVTGSPKFALSGTKKLAGRKIVSGEFTFLLKDAAGNEVARVANVGSGFTFLNVPLSGLGTHHFTLSELKENLGGITYDETVYDISVSVVDNGVGGMVVHAPVITKHGVSAAPVFENSYAPAPTDYTITAQKNYNKPLSSERFAFRLTGEGVNQTKYQDAAGLVTFDTVTFKQAGVYTYLVVELAGQKSYIDYDPARFTVTVDVRDDLNGNLYVHSVKTNDVENAKPTFTNTYTPAKANAVIAGTKVLLNSQPGAGDYSFDLYRTDDRFRIAGLQPIANTANDAQGSFSFGESDGLSFAAPGEYHFAVVENAANPKGGILYDPIQYNIVVTVVDNDEGALVAGVKCINEGEDGISFRNVPHQEIAKKMVFAENEPNVSIDGKKVYNGDILVYSIRYTNYTRATQNITIRDRIPDYTAYVEGSASKDGRYNGGEVTWDLEVKAEETVTVSFRVEVKADGAATIRNAATVIEGNNAYTTNEVTGYTVKDDVKKNVFAEGDLTTSIDGKKVYNGDILVYTISYTNTADVAADVTIHDTIPAGTTYVEGSADHGGVYAGGEITWNLKVSAGETVTVSFKAKVAAEKEVTVENEATVREGKNTYTTNKVASPVELPEDSGPPKTGDNSHLELWIMLMLVSCGAMVTLIVTSKKFIAK